MKIKTKFSVSLGMMVFLLAPKLSTTREVRVVIDTPMAPAAWASLERELLRANTQACLEFLDHYFDQRGYLLCVERWGGDDDGPDDAIANLTDWPVLHALGAPKVICQLGVVGVMSGRFVADLRIHQAQVTSCQIRKERDRKRGWLSDRSRWRPIRKRFWMTRCTDQNRCA